MIVMAQILDRPLPVRLAYRSLSKAVANPTMIGHDAYLATRTEDQRTELISVRFIISLWERPGSGEDGA